MYFIEFDISKRSIHSYTDRHETRGTTDRLEAHYLPGSYSVGHKRKMVYIKDFKVRKSVNHNHQKMASKLDKRTRFVGRVVKIIRSSLGEKKGTLQQVATCVAKEPGSS